MSTSTSIGTEHEPYPGIRPLLIPFEGRIGFPSSSARFCLDVFPPHAMLLLSPVSFGSPAVRLKSRRVLAVECKGGVTTETVTLKPPTSESRPLTKLFQIVLSLTKDL